jgi:hypothetical protein
MFSMKENHANRAQTFSNVTRVTYGARPRTNASVPQDHEFVHQKAAVGVTSLESVANKLDCLSVFLANRNNSRRNEFVDEK